MSFSKYIETEEFSIDSTDFTEKVATGKFRFLVRELPSSTSYTPLLKGEYEFSDFQVKFSFLSEATQKIEKIEYCVEVPLAPSVKNYSRINLDLKSSGEVVPTSLNTKISSKITIDTSDKWYSVPLPNSLKFKADRRGQAVNYNFTFNLALLCYFYTSEDNPYNKYYYSPILNYDSSFFTELIEKTIRNPINVFPYGNTIEPKNNTNFYFQFQGNRLMNYRINIYEQRTNNVIATFPEAYPNVRIVDNYNNDIINTLIPNSITQKLKPNEGYYWKIIMSQYNNPLEFNNNANYETEGFYFTANNLPNLNLTINSVPVPNQQEEIKPIVIKNKDLIVSSLYVHPDNIPIKYYSFYLYNLNGELLNSKEKIYSGRMEYSVHNLLNNTEYLLKIKVETQINQIKELEVPLSVQYQEPISFDSHLLLENNYDTNSVKISFLSDKNFTIPNLTGFEIGRIEGNSALPYNLGYYTIQELEDNMEQDRYILYDYGARNNQEYTYLVYPVTDTSYAKPSQAKIITDWENYALYPLFYDANEDKYKLIKNKDGNINIWNFSLNCKEADINLVQDKTVFESFSKLPRINIGNLAYHKGSLSCLLGNMKCFNGQDCLYEPNSLMQEWEAFIGENSVCLYKNPKGDVMIVFVQETSKTYMNEVGNIYNNIVLEENKITNRPSEIKFDYTEIANPNKYVFTSIVR